MPDLVGQQLGRYRLTRLLGHGGFADVYLGEHIYLDTLAAIKTLDTRLSRDEIEQFRIEARTIAQLEHPHIVRVLDFGVENDLPFLIMSYAPHGTLRQRNPRGARLPLKQAVTYANQVASALQYAHNQRLVHRDVKPENMLLGRNGEVLLSDFGLAVVARSSSRSGLHDVSGTILYMAPEQARGKPQPASDQYALGVTLYEWLCGVRPFQGTYEEVIVQHVFKNPPPLREHYAEISPSVEAVILKALEKEPARRFASVQEFALALEAASLNKDYMVDTPATITRTLPPQQEQERPTSGIDIIYAIDWSPDRRRIAYGGRDRVIQVRGATTGASTLLYHGHSGRVTTIAWSPDGRYIASASLDRTIQIWDATGGQRIATYEYHDGMVYALAWSPDNTLLASTGSGSDHRILICNIPSGTENLTHHGHSYWVRALAWSPDGTYLASGSWQDILIWEVKTERKVATYRGHTGWIRTLAWSPDGTRLASAGEDKTVQIWEPLNKTRLLTTYRAHTDWITSVIWSPNGTRLASGDRNRQVHIWDATTAQTMLTQQARSSSAYAIAWLPDNKHVVAANSNGSVQVWPAP